MSPIDRRSLVRTATVAAALVTSSLAMADPSGGAPPPSGAVTSTDHAKRIFAAGNEAFQAGDYEKACALFQESFSIGQANGPLYQWARCEEARGRLATALALWQRVREQIVDQPQVQDEANSRIEDLSARVARLIVEPVPTGTELELELDGRPIQPDEPVAVDRGTRILRVSARGASKTITVEVVDGEVKTVPVDAPEAPLTQTGGAAAGVDHGSRTAETPPYATIGWISLGVGAAGAIAFGVTAPMILGAESDLDALCPDRDRCDDPGAADVQSRGETLTTINTVGFVVGAVGIVGGVSLLVIDSLTAPDGPVAFRGHLQPGEGSFEVSIRF